MAEIHVRQLSDSEQQHLLYHAEQAEQRQLLSSVDSLDQLAGDLRTSLAGTDGELSTDISSALDVLAVALGIHIQKATGMHWASVTDGIQSTVVLVGVHGDNTVVVYPFDVVERRWKKDDPRVLRDYVEDVLHAIRSNQNVEGSAKSE